MSRRTSLPGADELFRTTSEGQFAAAGGTPGGVAVVAEPFAAPVGRGEPTGQLPGDGRTDSGTGSGSGSGTESGSGTGSGAATVSGVRRTAAPGSRRVGPRQPSGRQRHDEKITVYVSGEELLELEQARLTLRGDHGMVVDRGRIVREALAVVLADLETEGAASILVRRLRGQ